MIASCLGPEWVRAQISGLDRWAAVHRGSYVLVVQQLPTGPGEQLGFAGFVNHERAESPGGHYAASVVTLPRDVFPTPAAAASAALAMANRVRLDAEPIVHGQVRGYYDCDDPSTKAAAVAIAGALAETFDRVMRPLSMPPAAALDPAIISKVLDKLSIPEAMTAAVILFEKHLRRFLAWAVDNWPDLAPGPHGGIQTGSLVPDVHPIYAAIVAPDNPHRSLLAARQVLLEVFLRCKDEHVDGMSLARQTLAERAESFTKAMEKHFSEVDDEAEMFAACSSPATIPSAPTTLTAAEVQCMIESLATAVFEIPEHRPLHDALTRLQAAHRAGNGRNSQAVQGALQQVNQTAQALVTAVGIDDPEFVQRLFDVWTAAHDFPPIEVKVGNQAPSAAAAT
jgi:hypothetical protein